MNFLIRACLYTCTFMYNNTMKNLGRKDVFFQLKIITSILSSLPVSDYCATCYLVLVGKKLNASSF